MTSRKPIFFTSDLHLGHKKCIEFDERPFRDVGHMSSCLLENHNKVVPENGVTYFLGDIGWDTEMTKDYLSKANGIKICILGNHDKSPNAMYALGFDVVLYGATLYIHGERVTLSHCPLKGLSREDVSSYRKPQQHKDWHGSERSKNQKFTVKNEGQFHIHGHIHSRKGKAESERICGRQIDVGVPANRYTPVSLSEIESFISKMVKAEKRAKG